MTKRSIPMIIAESIVIFIACLAALYLLLDWIKAWQTGLIAANIIFGLVNVTIPLFISYAYFSHAIKFREW